MPDGKTTLEQELHLSLHVLRDMQTYPSTYGYIREAYEEQVLATRCTWDELGKHLQVAIHRMGNAVANE